MTGSKPKGQGEVCHGIRSKRAKRTIAYWVEGIVDHKLAMGRNIDKALQKSVSLPFHAFHTSYTDNDCPRM